MPSRNPPFAHRKALENLCLKKIQDFGGRATAQQIADNLDRSPEIIAPRLSDLAFAGKIRDTGDRHHAGKGRPRVIWEVCDRPGETPPRSDAPEWLERYGV